MISKRLKVIIVALLVIQLVIPSTILAAAVGQFTSVVGDVTQTSAGVVIKPEVKSPIQLKDLIVTGGRSTASMIFDDESTIGLAPNSNFEVKEFYIQDKTRKGLFSLTLGKLTADVKKFIGGESSFVVDTPTAVAGVRGTGFEIAVGMVGTQMTTTVTCTAGALSVSSLSVTGVVVSTVTIVAGQTAVVSAGVISVSATAVGAGAGAAGTGSAAGTGTAGTTGAAGTAGAGTTGAAGAGVAAGTAATAGVTAGTVAVGVAAAAAAVTAVVRATGSETTTTHHSTTTHH